MKHGTSSVNAVLVKRVWFWIVSVIFAVRFYFLDSTSDDFAVQVFVGIVAYVSFILFLRTKLLDKFLKEDRDDHRD